MQETVALKTTPLTQDHIARHAQMAPFAGWQMPIQYEGIIAETLHTRRSVSCFDICHMGEFLIEGDPQMSGLDRLLASRIDDMKIGSCRYSSILNGNGGVMDDLVVYRKARDSWMIVVNAATVDKDKAHFKKYLEPAASKFTDLSDSLGKIDVQGPLSRDVLALLTPQVAPLGYYTFIETDLWGEQAIISRTGYTGELGFELYVNRDRIPALWKRLLDDQRVKPAGLGARDILRLEMGYSLYGQDIDETTTPLEAGLERYVDVSRDFLGKETLLQQKMNGIPRHRVFFASLSRRSPRHHHKLFVNNGPVGSVTSGSFSPHLNVGIGMGFTSLFLKEGQRIQLGDETPAFEARVTGRPFLKETSLKS